MVYYDKDKRRLVWYEFQANVCYDGLRPYSAICVAKGKQRWWGYSIPELIHDIQQSIDRLWNGQFYRSFQVANPPRVETRAPWRKSLRTSNLIRLFTIVHGRGRRSTT